MKTTADVEHHVAVTCCIRNNLKLSNDDVNCNAHLNLTLVGDLVKDVLLNSLCNLRMDYAMCNVSETPDWTIDNAVLHRTPGH